MDIESLRVVVREDEINEYLPRAVPPDAGVENLHVRLVPEGLVLAGTYPTFLLKMSFETLWEVAAADGQVHARLSSIKVSGLPATLLRGVLLKVVRDMVAKQPGVKVEDDKIIVDVAEVLQDRQVPVRINLTTVRSGTGEMVIEAGPG